MWTPRSIEVLKNGRKFLSAGTNAFTPSCTIRHNLLATLLGFYFYHAHSAYASHTLLSVVKLPQASEILADTYCLRTATFPSPTDSILHPATPAAPLSIIFGTRPPSRYTSHSFFFPTILLFLLIFVPSSSLFLSLPFSLLLFLD